MEILDYELVTECIKKYGCEILTSNNIDLSSPPTKIEQKSICILYQLYVLKFSKRFKRIPNQKNLCIRFSDKPNFLLTSEKISKQILRSTTDYLT